MLDGAPRVISRKKAAILEALLSPGRSSKTPKGRISGCQKMALFQNLIRLSRYWERYKKSCHFNLPRCWGGIYFATTVRGAEGKYKNLRLKFQGKEICNKSVCSQPPRGGADPCAALRQALRRRATPMRAAHPPGSSQSSAHPGDRCVGPRGVAKEEEEEEEDRTFAVPALGPTPAAQTFSQLRCAVLLGGCLPAGGRAGLPGGRACLPRGHGFPRASTPAPLNAHLVKARLVPSQTRGGPSSDLAHCKLGFIPG